MKILVTGANGQVGSEIIQQGKQGGMQMIAAGHAELDITQIDDIKRIVHLEQPDIIINAAAYTAVDKAEEQIEQKQAYAINRDGPANLAQVCAETKIPLLHVSTDYVFDGMKESAYTEADIPNPSGVYGKSKLEGEQVIAATLEQYYIIRVAWVFGAKGNNFVRTMLRLSEDRNELNVVSDQRGTPTWAQDIAHVLLVIAEYYKNNRPIHWGIYHYAGTPSTTWAEFANRIFEVAQRIDILDRLPKINPISTEKYPTPAQRPKNSVLDCSQLTQALNIPASDWKKGLEAVLNTWKQQ